MPVTKTAKRALRGSKNKEYINKLIMNKLGFALRTAKKSKATKDILTATALSDRAAKKKVIHKNKAARIKSQLSKLFVSTPKTKVSAKEKASKSKAKK